MDQKNSHNEHHGLHHEEDRPFPLLHRVIILVGILLSVSIIEWIFVHQQKQQQKTQAYIAKNLSLPAANVQQKTQLNSAAKQALEPNWHTITVEPGDTLDTIFSRMNLSNSELSDMLTNRSAKKILSSLKPSRQLKLLIDQNNQVKELVYRFKPLKELEIKQNPTGYSYQELKIQPTYKTSYAGGMVNNSLYLTGQRLGIPFNLMQQLVKIFSWEIDFSKDVHTGDRFKILYQTPYVEDTPAGNSQIIAAAFYKRNRVYRAIRYSNGRGGYDYFTPEGKSLRKTLIRKPVKYTRISSRFSLHRMNPVLHIIRAHTGVDYAAPRGTPIHAAGSGVIRFAGRRGGYGKAVIIDHGKHYQTLYGHMTRFARGMRAGVRVKQGQIIGYVGSTGVATGPHLHFEIRINGRPKNPLTVKLPTANPIPKSKLAKFKTYANTLIADLNQPRQMVAENNNG